MFVLILFTVVGLGLFLVSCRFLGYYISLIVFAGTMAWLLVSSVFLITGANIINDNLLVIWISCSVAVAVALHLWPRFNAVLREVCKNVKTTHGTAEFAGKETEEKYTRGNGLALGVTRKNKKFRVGSHILSCAPTRSGKDVGAIIPCLLEHKGSIIVNDIKGEDYAVTHRQREALGNKVFLVDPFGITGGKKNCFNWLDLIDVKNPDCVGQALMIADMLIATEKASNDSHFDESAKNLLQGLILLAASDPDESQRNIVTVREMLTLPEASFMALMQGCIGHPAAFDIISRCASKISGTPDRERGSIISTAQRYTAFLDDPRVAETLRKSDFDLGKIKDEFMSVYLVLPSDKLRINRSFIRVFFGLALSAVTATQGKPEEDIIFLFNEFGQLGYMAEIEEKISLVRSYGAVFWVFVQDLSQLKGIYQKWQTFMANSTRQFFGCNDLDTAKYISESLGKFTETIETGVNKDTFVSRNLLDPDEVMRLPTSRIIAFVQGEAPAMLDRITYYQDKDYEGKFDKNPFHA